MQSISSRINWFSEWRKVTKKKNKKEKLWPTFWWSSRVCTIEIRCVSARVNKHSTTEQVQKLEKKTEFRSLQETKIAMRIVFPRKLDKKSYWKSVLMKYSVSVYILYVKDMKKKIRRDKRANEINRSTHIRTHTMSIKNTKKKKNK